MHHKPLLLMLGHILMYLFSLPLTMLGITRSLIIIYVILLRMRTHSCIIVGIVEEKGKNTVLGRKRLGKDFLSKKGRQTHTHISGAKGETITNIWSSPRRISACVEPIQEDTWTSGERTVVCQSWIGREESLRVKRKQVQCL